MLDVAFAWLHPRAPWELFQLVAVFVGALLVARASRVHVARNLAAFAAGVVAAAALALAVGSGPAWARWALAGRAGAAPAIEIAGAGALLGFVLGAALVSGRHRDATFGALAVAVGPMLALSRLGCFVAGCDFGAPTRAPWAVHHPPHTPAFAAQREAHLIAAGAPATLATHPTQLYEAAAGLVLFVLARHTPSRGRARLLLVIAAYAVMRFAIDFARGDLAHGLLGLTMTQWIAAAVIVAVVGWRIERATAQR